MAQRLTLPINDMRITASINSKAYKTKFGYPHHGADLVSISKNREILSSGKGQVLGFGNDKICGKVLVVVYKDVFCPTTKEICDVVFRYIHLEKILVAKGQVVSSMDILGEYGNTGTAASTGKHLHLESDLDTVNFLHTPTVFSSDYLRGTSQGAFGGEHKNNTIKNPLAYLHVKNSYPHCQTFSSVADAFVNTSDQKLPSYTEDETDTYLLLSENQKLKETLGQIKALLS